jgi:hypothetical protein
MNEKKNMKSWERKKMAILIALQNKTGERSQGVKKMQKQRNRNLNGNFFISFRFKILIIVMRVVNLWNTTNNIKLAHSTAIEAGVCIIIELMNYATGYFSVLCSIGVSTTI